MAFSEQYFKSPGKDNFMKKYFIGIDLGGTFIKGGIVEDTGAIIEIDKTPTEVNKGNLRICENIAALTERLIERANIDRAQIVGIGMGTPGMIDTKSGILKCAENLLIECFPIADELKKLTGFNVVVANDANVATLGEVKFGAAKNKQNAIMITLGTGVGGGMVCNGVLVEGNEGAGAELGHTVIAMGGELCSCGRRGCAEAYASATALIRETKKAMKNHKDSKMWSIGDIEAVDGKTVFDFADSDVYAKEVLDNYIYALATIIVNFANIFRPDAIILGGGICAQGENLTTPLQKIVNEEIYGGELGPQVPVLTASLGNTAGVLGAAALLMD